MNTDDAALEDLTEDGDVVDERMPSCKDAQATAMKMIQYDVTRAARRLKVQGAFDGNAPKTIAEMQRAKREGDSNINWKEFKGNIINAWNPFFDLVCEIPVCIDAQLDFYGADIDQEAMRGFAEAFHEMLFSWKGFDNMNQLRDLQMLLHGPGPLAFEDEWLPFPRPILASDFYVDEMTEATFENAELIMITNSVKVGNLWREIRDLDDKEANAVGWNRQAVKDAIMLSGTGTNLQTLGKSWDRWQQMFKNGDIYINTIAKKVKLATMFVREMDGRITKLVFTYQQSEQSNAEYLYKNVGLYDSWDQALCMFYYDIGADGTFHSIKGLGTEIYPFCALSNRIKNSIADLVTTGIKPMFQPVTGGKIEDFNMVKLGGFNMIKAGLTKVDLDIGKSIVPALEASRDFSQTLVQNTGSYSQADLAAPTVEETAKSAIIRATERAKLTKGSHNRFYRALDGLYAEIWRRVTRKDLEPHHLVKNPQVRDLVMEFRETCASICKRLDIPNDAVQKVKKVKATRSIGLGSAAMRIEIANAIMEKWAYLPDEASKNNALRAYFSALTSYANVDAFAPSLNNKPQISEDAWAATMENDALNNDGEVVITPKQNPIIHLQVHIASMERDAEAVQAGQMDPRQAVQRMHAKGVHSWQHMKLIEGNPVRKQEYDQFSQRLAENAALQDQLEQNIEEQDAANQPPPQPDPDMAKVQGTLQLKAQKQDGDMALKARKQQFDEAQKLRQQQFDQSLEAHGAITSTAIKVGQTAAQIAIDKRRAAATNGVTH